MTTQLILTATEGGLAGREFRFSGPTQCLIGRSHGCTLKLCDDYTVSRMHCLLDVSPTGVAVCDLGSMNGTFVNGKRTGAAHRESSATGATDETPVPRRLADGDELRVGFTVFRVGVAGVRDEPVRWPAEQCAAGLLAACA